MAASFALARPRPLRPTISLTPMIDVLLILLVFFMVTSTYRDLDMIPAGDTDAEEAAAQTGGNEARGASLLVRIGADGRPAVAGTPLDAAALAETLTAAARENRRVLVLPSAAAPVQALVTVLDAAARAEVAALRVVRLEARP